MGRCNGGGWKPVCMGAMGSMELKPSGGALPSPLFLLSALLRPCTSGSVCMAHDELCSNADISDRGVCA